MEDSIPSPGTIRRTFNIKYNKQVVMKPIKGTPGVHAQVHKSRNCLSGLRTPDRYDGLLAIGVILYAVIFSYLSLFRYNTFQLEYDLAVFNQALWNTVMHGELLTNSLEQVAHSMAIGSHMGVHFSPILFSLVPFYLISPSSHTLLIAQSVLLALGAVPIYFCGREILGKGAGCIIAFTYLIYPPLHGVNLYDFHEVAFLPVLMGFVLWGYVSGKRNMMLLFALLALLVKEDVSIIIFMIGLVGMYQTRNESLSSRWHFLVLMIMSVLTLLIFFLVIHPYFIPSAPIGSSGFLQQYMDPVHSATQHSSYRFDYILKAFTPLLFVPLLAPELLLISIPSFIEILFSGSIYYSVWFHYSALIISTLFIATIIGLSRIRSWEGTVKKNVYTPVLCLILISSLICLGLFSPAAEMVLFKGTYNEAALDEHREYIERVISVIPQEASISTQYNLLPMVSSRKMIWVDYQDGADIVLLDNAFEWRAKDFTDNQKSITEEYELILEENYVSLYVNKNNPSLLSELSRRVSSL
jgi:uncharacterized membrane protein